MESTIKVLSSGSVGNCILVYDNRGKYIALDLGIHYKDILRGAEYNLNDCVSACVTHRHGDHVKALFHFIENGVPCFANQDVCERYKGCNLIESGTAIRIDGFRLQTFDLVHDVPNNAFVIDTNDGIRVLYCTDTRYIPQLVKNVHYAIIECNNDLDVMVDNMCKGEESRSHFEQHHSLDKCIEYLRKIYNPDLQAVILSHISDTNGDPIYFVKRVKEELGFDSVFAAEKDLTIPLQLSEF